MKNVYKIWLLTLCCITVSITNLIAGNSYPGNVVIENSNPNLDQSKVEMDIAFNGWIYAGYITTDSANGNKSGITVRLSKDNGVTWQTFTSYTSSNSTYLGIDIALAGTDTNNLQLIVATSIYVSTTNLYAVQVSRYNAATGASFSPLTIVTNQRSIRDIAIATDYKFPAQNAAPYSIGLAYAVGSTLDSLNFICSMDAGATWRPSTNVATSTKYITRISMAYGYSNTAYFGRYFIAWEDFQYSNDRKGHVFVSKNYSFVDGPFSSPMCLDSINGSNINNLSNPRVAVSQTNGDNDSSSITAVVLCESDYYGDGSDIDVIAFSNKTASNTNHWKRVFVSSSGSSREVQPDVWFDRNSKKFMATCLDSTQHILPYFTNDLNISDPNGQWNRQIINYDGSGNLLANAFPRVVANPLTGKATFVWIRNNPSYKKGVAYINAEDGVSVRTTLNVTNCRFAPYYFNLQYLNTSGTYMDTLYTASYADSIITLNYTRVPVPNNTFNASTCTGIPYSFNGQNLLTAGTYIDTLVTTGGCDSIATLVLTVNVPPLPTITQAGNILSTQNYTDYQWQLNTNDIPLANAQTYTAVANGNYTVMVTDANNCTATSAAVNVTGVGINSIANSSVQIYPNPASDVLNIAMQNTEDAQVIIMNAEGQIMMEEKINTRLSLNIKHFSPGAYFVKITQGNNSGSLQFVKQ